MLDDLLELRVADGVGERDEADVPAAAARAVLVLKRGGDPFSVARHLARHALAFFAVMGAWIRSALM